MMVRCLSFLCMSCASGGRLRERESEGQLSGMEGMVRSCELHKYVEHKGRGGKDLWQSSRIRETRPKANEDREREKERKTGVSNY